MRLSLRGPRNAYSAALRTFNRREVPRQKEFDADTVFRSVLGAWMHDPTEETVRRAMVSFFGFFRPRLVVAPDGAAALAALRERGLPIGVLTDVPYGMPRSMVEDDITTAGIGKFVDVLLTSVAVGWRKPDPRGFAMLAERLGVCVSDMLYVGNEPKDVIGAARAGCVGVLLDSDGTCGEHGQAATVRSLSEVVLRFAE